MTQFSCHCSFLTTSSLMDWSPHDNRTQDSLWCWSFFPSINTWHTWKDFLAHQGACQQTVGPQQSKHKLTTSVIANRKGSQKTGIIMLHLLLACRDIWWVEAWQCKMNCIRADSRFAPSQCETTLLCNDVSHWLGTSLESALCMCPYWWVSARKT